MVRSIAQASISYGRGVAISVSGDAEPECLIHVGAGNATTPVMCRRGIAEPARASVGCTPYLPWSQLSLHKQPSHQPAQLAASCGVVRVPHCHCTAGDYQSTSLRRNLEARHLQGSEQNMDSVPLGHRSIAICNPSWVPPAHMTAFCAMSFPTKYRVPGNGRPLTSRQHACVPRFCVALWPNPVPPASVWRRTSQPPRGPTRFDTLSYEPYVPL